MKKEKEELVELKNIEELNKKKKEIPEEIQKLMRKKVFVNILRAISIFLYFIALNVTFTKLSQNNLVNCLEIVSGILLVTSLVEFERAYKKDSGVIAISAIELLVLAMHALTIIHICTLAKFDEKIYVLTSSYVFAIYYVLKSIIAYSIMKKEYIKSLNDISDIIKKDEPVKKEAIKKTKTKKIDDSEEEKTLAKKTTRKRTTGTKTTTAKSKSTSTKIKKVDEDVEEKKPIRRKTTTTKTATKPKSARGTKRTIKKEEVVEEKPKTKTSTVKKTKTAKTSTVKKTGTAKTSMARNTKTTKISTAKKTGETKKKATTKSKKEVEAND